MTDRRSSLTQEEEAKFQQYWDMAEASDADIDSEEEWDLYDQMFPTPAEAKAYNNWWRKKVSQKEKKPEPAAAATVPADSIRPEPYPLLNSGFHPHVPIGHKPSDFKTAYRLVPNTGYLEPTKEMNWKHNSDKVVLPAMVLGINHTVQLNKPAKEKSQEEWEAIYRYICDDNLHSSDGECLDTDPSNPDTYVRLANKVRSFDEPGRRFGRFGRPGPPSPLSDHTATINRNRVLSEESTRSGDSASPNDDTGFAFYQIGALHYCCTLDDPTTTDLEQIFAEEWYSSNYIVVAKIDGHGRLKDIWLIWDFWAERENGNPVWVRPNGLCGAGPHFSAAKIADSFADLGASYLMVPSEAPGECFTEDFELVGCFRLPDGQIIRQWVVEGVQQPDS